MAERPFADQKLCWFSDISDSEYRIDFVPDSDRSLIILSGASGHGFKMMPVLGRWVLDVLRNGEQKLPPWQWLETDMRGAD